MGRTVLYGKVGRSIPLTLEKCGVVGGDNEPLSVLKVLAERNPADQFVIIGRNSGERPEDVRLPPNVVNPWVHLAPIVKNELRAAGLRGNFSITDQLHFSKIIDHYTLPWFDAADAIIMWAGQHGTSNSPIPMIGDRTKLTKPQDSFVNYAGFLLRGINHWRDQDPIALEEIWLNADPRNYLKMRDLKWPLRHSVLAQYTYHSNIKHERYEAGLLGLNAFTDPTVNPMADHLTYEENGDVWKTSTQNVYSGLELCGLLPGTPVGDMLTHNANWAERGRFGLFVNETRAIGVRPELQRRVLMRDWVLPLQPDFVHGSWSDAGLTFLGVDIQPAPWMQYVPKLQSVRCTFTMPGSGSKWATIKPWEAFAAGTVCFFHPEYDAQDNILTSAPTVLREWLRVNSPAELETRVNYLSSPLGRDTWQWLVKAQREHFEHAIREPKFITMIEERINQQEA